MRDDALVVFSGDISYVDQVNTAIRVLLYSLADNSKRQYAHTFRLWRDFARDNDLDVLDFSAENVIAFVESHNWSHSTKMNKVSHISRLVRVLAAYLPDDSGMGKMKDKLELVTIPKAAEESHRERPKFALNKHQVYSMINYWDQHKNREMNKYRRNSAILAVLICTGVRRDELVHMQWDDVYLDEQKIRIRHGKGAKERYVAILGDGIGVPQLERWRDLAGDRRWLFCSVNKSDRLNPEDLPLSASAVYRLVQSTGLEVLGLKGLSPHDGRRTLFTNMLKNDTGLQYVQDQAGHVDGSTTLRYALSSGADDIKANAKVDW